MSRISMPSAARRTPAPAKLHIGPKDAGLPFTWEEYKSADYEPGFRYELIDGRLVVAAMPKPKHAGILSWIYDELFGYGRRHRHVFDFISPSSEVVVHLRAAVTAPQPDISVYRDFPHARLDDDDFDWDQVSPIIVVEVVSPDSSDKDFFRNVTLYELVASIREYWIVNPRDGINKRRVHVYRRRGEKWLKPIVLNMGETYTTKLLPGFRLRLEPIQ